MIAPNLPVGLLTKLGVIAAAISAIVAGVTAVLHGDHTPETIAAILAAAISIYGTIRARGDQNAALIQAAAAKPVGYVSPADHPGAARG